MTTLTCTRAVDWDTAWERSQPISVDTPRGSFQMTRIEALTLASRISRAVRRVQPAGDGRALSEKEIRVLALMAVGSTNREIGQELWVSEDTVKSHARHLFRKLGARDRAHAVAIGIRSGLIS